MADDNNHTLEEQKRDDIEQGTTIPESANPDSVLSGVAGAIAGDAGGDSASHDNDNNNNNNTRPLGGIENVDVEDDEAPIPFTTSANNDMSTTPTQTDDDVMLEQIEDGAVPRPLNSAEFEEDEATAKIDLEMESSDEDDGPSLPVTFSHERESLSDDAKKIAASPRIASSSNDDNEASDDAASIEEDPGVRQMNDHQSPVDEENNPQHLVEPPQIDSHSASYLDDTRQIVSTAAERYQALHITEAYLVEEEEVTDDALPLPLTATVATLTPGGRDTVYEATPLEPNLPWWKERRSKVSLAIIFLLSAALLSVVLGLSFSSPNPVKVPEADNNNSSSTSTNNTNNSTTSTAAAPSISTLSPTESPTKRSYRCFDNRNELKTLVDRYVKNLCGISITLCSDVSNTYGWPIGSWCVGNLTDMSSLNEL